MTNEEFDIAFEIEFPEFNYLFGEFEKSNVDCNNEFIQYIVEYVFELVDVGNSYRGFDGSRYSAADPSLKYENANQYTFDFLVKNKDLLAFWLL